MLVDRDTTLLSREPLPHDGPHRLPAQGEATAGVLQPGGPDTPSAAVPVERGGLGRGGRGKPLLAWDLTKRAALAALASIAVALVLHFDLWRCPIAEVFGLPCPGCGLTRAASALLKGDFPGAMRLQPLSPLVIPLAAFAASREVLRFVWGAPRTPRAEEGARERRQRQRRAAGRTWHASGGRWLDRASVCVVVLLLGVWVLRFFGVFGGPVRVASHLFG
jgi:uncharacterized protein DUF2752